MDELKEPVGERAKSEARPEPQDVCKEAWVTPVVREYDPADVTKTFFSGTAATDNVYYS